MAGYVVGGLVAVVLVSYGLIWLLDARGLRTRICGQAATAIERSRLTGNPVPSVARMHAYYPRAYGVFMLVGGLFTATFLVLMTLFP
ncbi:hypothetical protein KSE_63870 [Kitasatospora setae KM-6054]|uniref:Uncharacterized protein n=1 Tax=Kitasatospora setae (strain ATCC 33774 / DSM 43861 / JCM 3304 / KCC A-0304 / NBRC 14216 / KM-6054) TaxID=452652 RepID=E4N1W2_KITSK|nr:hypothetical protein KSE_63870 [Kitasatospora setae KM-6054]